MYSRQLRGYDIRDVEKAVMELAKEPREDYKAAFPELGAIISRVEAIRDSRQRRPRFVACAMNGCKGGYLRTADAKYSYVAECDCLGRWRRGEQAAVPDPIAQHLADSERYPERFVPVEACVQVGRDMTAAKLARARAGTPMSDAECRELRKRLTHEMNERWLRQIEAQRDAAAVGSER